MARGEGRRGRGAGWRRAASSVELKGVQGVIEGVSFSSGAKRVSKSVESRYFSNAEGVQRIVVLRRDAASSELKGIQRVLRRGVQKMLDGRTLQAC